ncbi:MAG: anaerobic benzoate catabolism transcriptional regulator [Pelotomaculum sp. PtaB.Bin013]|uniref:Helix-turn-helix domain-containing protein n=1 Tax=Pelotomaculum isophthalicicum JI TaxID=947010 RepID=A0A9X4JU70_9FIRM|nr:helix-turn-helix transcriptional regulator [Pelotomaculum isophthalicicum]MDF9410014.1 helix-turn-helix domain-containing protein [Pelotomaculum isophthalicicum JI]OPX89886.1 MAG: anaerobic benzoate catabolism transcriptional regulator [Pelotomaculum sp. PtaB.Bin013]
MIAINGIGNRLKTLRERSGLNQAQLAAFLNVDQSYISKCEKGERQLSVDALEKACCLFGCTLDELSDGNDDIKHLQFAFRAASISKDDLAAISDINKIALNLKQMRQLLEVAHS